MPGARISVVVFPSDGEPSPVDLALSIWWLITCMPSEEKKAEYNANKREKRHLKQWQADPKTIALQQQLRDVQATAQYGKMAATWMGSYKNVQDMVHEGNAARRLAEQRAKGVAERDLARHKEHWL